jgi:hypothetical protein
MMSPVNVIRLLGFGHWGLGFDWDLGPWSLGIWLLGHFSLVIFR